MSLKNIYFKIFIVAVLGMMIFVSLLGNIDMIIGPFEVELGLSFFNHGFTRLEIPPLGKVWAQTHVPPLKLSALLKNINLDLLREDIALLSEETYVEDLVNEIERKLSYFALRLLFLGFLGGFAGVYVLLSKKNNYTLLGGGIGFLVIAILLLSLYISFNPYAFINPEFEGVLEAAPWVFGLLEETLIKVATLGEQLETIAINLFLLFERIDFLEPLGLVEGERKILHVSDIHNNPAALRFINQVITSFDVDFIIDTGDLADFGSPLEAELAARVGDLGVPYIFVPGNHDSPAIINTLKNLEGVTVLEKDIIEVKDVIIAAGIQDPSSFSPEMTVPSEEELDRYADDLKMLIRSEGITPDIVAAHHPRIVSAFIGEVHILLTGHTHALNIDQIGESIIINAGTSGAAGIRGLQSAREVPFSVVLLHLNKEEGESWRLTAADTIKVFQFESGFSLSRILFIDSAVREGIEVEDEEENEDEEDNI